MRPEVGRLIIFSVILIVYLIALNSWGPITDNVVLPVAVIAFMVPVIGILDALNAMYRRSRSESDPNKRKNSD